MLSEGQRNDINYAIPVLDSIDIDGSQVAACYDKLVFTYIGFICLLQSWNKITKFK